MSFDGYKFAKPTHGGCLRETIQACGAFMNNLPPNMPYSNFERAPWTVRRNQSPRCHWSGFLLFAATLAINLTAGEVRAEDPDDYLTREGKRSLIDPEHKSLYERKLFVTSDEVARYVFLTNAPN